MKHLSPEQLVDVAEGTGEAAHAEHAASCEACRSSVDGLRAAIALASADPPPEPSPIVWEHLAARIGAAVRREPQARGGWNAWKWRLAPVGAAAVVVTAVGFGVTFWPAQAPHRAEQAAAASQPADEARAVPVSAGEAAPPDDASWLLVSDLSADVAFDEAEAAGALTGAADRALLQLNESERVELARLLRDEMARPARRAPQGPGRRCPRGPTENR